MGQGSGYFWSTGGWVLVLKGLASDFEVFGLFLFCFYWVWSLSRTGHPGDFYSRPVETRDLAHAVITCNDTIMI